MNESLPNRCRCSVPFDSMQQGKMFFMMGLCMASMQGGYVRRIPHGKEITAAMRVREISLPRRSLERTREKDVAADLFETETS